MAYDLEEQEQIEEIKAWWQQYGKLVLLAVVSVFVTIAAFQGWRYYRHQQALGAVTLYSQLQEADRARDGKRVIGIAEQIVDKYASTPYAEIAALTAARASFDAGDLAVAKTRLQWVIDKANDKEMQDIARLRLAGVLLDEKKYPEALKILEAKPVDSYNGLFADMRGDILVAQGKIAEARTAYQQALDKSDAKSPYSHLVQLKLDALGAAK